jgi:hypothetical protein
MSVRFSVLYKCLSRICFILWQVCNNFDEFIIMNKKIKFCFYILLHKYIMYVCMFELEREKMLCIGTMHFLYNKMLDIHTYKYNLHG